MEEPSVRTAASKGTPGSETEITIERLEFGKFCVSPDGPIESNRENIPIEHSQLGWSDGFPKNLVPACYPTKLGIVQEDGETLPSDEPGTVLRPVVRGAQKEVRQVLYRVRARAENGERKSGRRYTLARYLAVPGEHVNPLTMLAAMNSLRLRGITRAGAREMPAIEIEQQELQLDHIGEVFLREALIYILSGVAISLTEHVLETKFFTWVTAVHNCLPPVLKLHLSAGWNVGSSYSGKLGISYTTHRAAGAAHFSPTTLRWSAPEYVTTWNSQREPVTNSFFEERLEPGRLFERYVFNEGLPEGSMERSSTLADSLPPVDLPELPGWDDPGTVRIFRYPGLQARDQFTIKTVADWLQNKTDEDVAPGVLNARNLSYHPNKIKVLSLILQALAAPSSRSRADQALWLSINGKAPPSFTSLLERATGGGAQRARLIAAIGSGGVFNTLRALQNTSPEECEDLPDNVNAKLLEILDQSLRLPIDRRLMTDHVSLLLSPSSQYLEWVKQHSLELMKVLAFLEGTPPKALTALVEISGSKAIKALQYFLTNDTLTASVESVLRRLNPAEREVFIETFDQRWRQKNDSTASRREALLKWFSILAPTQSRDALLRLVLGTQLTDADVRDIAGEVESGDVPESLLPGVAELALRRWSLLRQRISSESNGRRWLQVTGLWPKPYARVLAYGTGTDTPDPAIAHTAEQLRLDPGDLEYLLTIWFPFEGFKEAAPLLWDWAIALESRHVISPTAFDLCRHFREGRLPDCDISTKTFDDFVRLVKYCGREITTPSGLKEMWNFASRAWQVQLLLMLFPQENLEPTLNQLSLLIPHRTWLRDHLHNSQTRFDRQGFFGIATQSFHSLSTRDSTWRDDFVTCPLWAMFQGVPVSTLPHGALRVALRVFTESDGRTAKPPQQIFQEQARLCLTFLRSYQGAPSEDGAMRRTLFEFVLPHYSEMWSRDRFEAAVGFIGAEMKLPGFNRTNKYSDRFGPTMYELISQILGLCDRKSLNYMIKEFFNGRENAT